MNLSVIQEIMPDFTIDRFIIFDEIVSLHWVEIGDESGECRRHLILSMTSFTGLSGIFDFVGVSMFHFHGNGQIGDFTIEDMNERGYENGLRYKVSDAENDNIGFYCADILIRSVERI